jgi:GDPmannose 4,6-dehydratase
MRMKKALITGITGQDGSYLAELLLEKKYEVHGIVRNTSLPSFERISHILSEIYIHKGDLTDFSSLLSVISAVRPDEIYNLAAQSHVGISFNVPIQTSDVNAVGILRILEIVRLCGLHETRIYQASTSELFGGSHENVQSEDTQFSPCSPYAISKLFAHWAVVNARNAYNLFAVSGILFNHESPRRGPLFVTSKIIAGVASFVKLGKAPIVLGNLDAKRDFGHAKDYVKAMWMMLQSDKAQDYCICTGVQISVRSFVEKAFAAVGMNIRWNGNGLQEVGTVNGTTVIVVDPSLFRPTDVESLLGSSKKAQAELGWRPTISLDSLISEMLDAAMKDLCLTRPDVTYIGA